MDSSTSVSKDTHTLTTHYEPSLLAHIQPHALRVLNQLKQAGYQAYIVGGGIRDLLLNLAPKDFDIATDAHPEEIKALFHHCRLIGRRFRLAHVYFGKDMVEVATFRGHSTADAQERKDDRYHSESGRIMRDNVYGSIEEDAQRRDFSINAFYYDAQQGLVLDYAAGYNDLKNRTLRLLGNPEVRYREDPVRMLRAIRFAVKLNFQLESHTETALVSLGHLLHDVSSARLYDEVLKLFLTGQAYATYTLLKHYGLFKVLFPQAAACIKQQPEFDAFIQQALINTDERIRLYKPVTAAFLFAVFLWGPLQKALTQYRAPIQPATLFSVAQQVLQSQALHIRMPRFVTRMSKEIWYLQHRLAQRKKADQLLHHPRFRAAYDFLLLREQAGENTHGLEQWWTDYQQANANERKNLQRAIYQR